MLGKLTNRKADMNHPNWPALPFAEWRETATTLQMWTQIVGKVRLALSPWVNHSWHVTLYLTARGLTTSPIPHDQRVFEIEFDFVRHQLAIRSSDGEARTITLRAPGPPAIPDGRGYVFEVGAFPLLISQRGLLAELFVHLRLRSSERNRRRIPRLCSSRRGQ